MWGLQGQDCAFRGGMQPSDVAFRVRMLAALMQLCTIVVSEVGLGRSSALFVDPHDMLFSWCWTSGSEVLAVECTCKHELCMIIQSGVRSTQYCKNVLRATSNECIFTCR